MPLRIGQVSKLFNIPIDTLRYYDKERVLQPGRMDHNGYRLYDVWDIFNLTDLTIYRGLGISLKDIKNILTTYGLEDLETLLFEKYEDMENKIRYQHVLSKYIYNLYDRLSSVNYNIDNFWVKKDPRSYHVLCTGAVSEEYSDFEYNNPLLREFIKTSPFYRAELVTDLEHIQKSRDYIQWDLSLDEEYFSMFDIKLSEEITVFEPQLSVHTIIDMGEKGGLDIHSLKHILSYMAGRSYQPAGKIRGEILARVHQGKRWHRYVEIKIPIK